jgi:hypothetical protein
VLAAQFTQADDEVEPVDGLYFPAVHEVHPVAPVVEEYLPVIQAGHEDFPVFAAEVPTGQEVLYKQSIEILHAYISHINRGIR